MKFHYCGEEFGKWCDKSITHNITIAVKKVGIQLTKVYDGKRRLVEIQDGRMLINGGQVAI